MKTILAFLLCAICVSAGSLLAQSPTPFPVATPRPSPIIGTVTLTAAQWQAALTTVPATPQSILAAIQSVIAMPPGADFAHFRGLSFVVLPNGSARVTVQFAPQ